MFRRATLCGLGVASSCAALCFGLVSCAPKSETPGGDEALWGATSTDASGEATDASGEATDKALPQGDDERSAASSDGSAAPSPAASPTTRRSADPRVPELVREIAARQERRLRRLQFLESSGVVEFRWKDDKGNHFEQCDLRLFAMPPTKTAFRLSKLSDQYAWLGSDAEQWWVFRLKDSPTTVEVRPWREDRGDGISAVSPRSILALSGFAPYPASPAAKVEQDVRSARLIVDYPATEDAPRSRVRFEPVTLLPRAVELLDERGAVIASSVLEDYASAPADGIAPGEFPKVARRVIISRADGDGSIKLSLNEPSARGQRIRPEFFQLDELMRNLRPDEVILRAEPLTPESTR